MFGVTEDEEYFNPSSSSNLASLFGTSMTFQTNNETDLSYTAPKQPKAQEKHSKPQSSVVCSKFVDVFKLVNNEHVHQGKSGIAIIGNETLNVHEVILYKSKQDIITRSKLKTSFLFRRQTNNFACFCDDQQQCWSVHFQSVTDIDDFSKQLQLHNGEVVQEVEANMSEQYKKDKDNSDPLSDTSTSKTKASILSRMAKMGQSILPKVDSPQSESDISDSEEKTITKKVKKTRQPKEKVTTDQTVNLPLTQSEFVVINGRPIPVSAFQQNLNLSTFNQPLWNHPQSLSDPLNIFIAENRTHNCEMRMNVTQLSSKLDRIYEEISKTKPVFLSNSSVNQESYENGDLKKLENENLALRNKLKTANEAITSVTVENENYKLTISKQEETIDDLLQKMVKYDHLKKETEKQRTRIKELDEMLSNQKPQLETLTEFYEEHKTCDNSKIIEELSELNVKLKSQLADNVVRRDLFSKKLKQAMNVLYQTMMETFSEENVAFRALEIKEVLSKNLKTTTFNVIEEFNKDFNDEVDERLPSVPN